MTPEQAATVLAKISTLDARINAASPETARAKAQAWAEVLDPAMPVQWALDHVLDHYRARRDLVMPSDLNQAWKALRARQRDRDDVRSLTTGEGVPMPENVRRALYGILEGR
jgi:hypothetical protein